MPPDNPTSPRRQSIRLAGFDYATAGAYFITIVTQNRALVLGEVDQSSVALSGPGRMVLDWWNRLPSKFPEVALDEVVVMPNHLHGVLWLTTGLVGQPLAEVETRPKGRSASSLANIGGTSGQTRGSAPTSLAAVVVRCHPDANVPSRARATPPRARRAW